MKTRWLVFSFVLLAFCAAAIGFPIKGTVVDMAGKPVPGINVTALTSVWTSATWNGSVVREKVTTDKAGAFVLRSIDIKPGAKRARVGDLTLVAVEPGGLIGWRFLPVSYILRNRGANDLASVKITVATTGTVEGKVTDESGKPVASAKVECDTFNLKSAKARSFDSYAHAKYLEPAVTYPPVHTDAQGVYRILNVPENVTPTVHVSKPGLAMKPEPYNAPATLDIVMVPGGSASGRIVDDKGVGQAGALVTMSGDSMSPNTPTGWGKAVTGKDGSFVVDGLVPGEYRLTAYPLRDDHIQFNREQIRVTAGETTKLPDILSPPAAYVTGRVLDADTGKPIAGAQIHASSEQFHGAVVTSDEQGNYRIAVLPGDIGVYYMGGSPMYMVDWRTRRKPVTVPPTGLTGYDIKLKCNGACSGIVVGPDGKPLADALVSIGRRPEGVQTRTDAKGRFALGLPPNVDLSGG